jgi:hypothetical protein
LAKKRILFIAIVVLSLLSSCGTLASPETSYARQMEPAVEPLKAWQNEFSALESLLTDQLDSSSGITRLQLIELYNVAMEYEITRDDYAQLGLSPLDALVGPAVGISRDGDSLLKSLSAVTPVDEMKEAHQAILDCLGVRIAFADELSSSIKDLSAIDMDKAGELVACDPFDAAVEKLATFVSEHQDE